MSNRKRIINLLKEYPAGLTARQISVILDLDLNTASREMTRMRDLTYIADYKKTYSDGPAAAMFALGQEDDAPRPKKLTNEERKKRSARLRQAQGMNPLKLQLKLLQKGILNCHK